MLSKAESVTIDAITYNLNEEDKTAIVLGVTTSGDIVIPEKVACNNIDYAVVTIGSSAFDERRDITSICIPRTITTIKNYAFCMCSGLKAVHISDIDAWCRIKFGFQKHGDTSSNPLIYAHHLYLNGEEITEVIIPYDLTMVNECTFVGMSSLTKVTIPEGIRKIGYTAFEGCVGLKTIELPSTLTSIDDLAFNHCSGLTDFICNASDPPVLEYDCPDGDGYPFFNTDLSSIVLHVPPKSVEKYNNTWPWRTFKEIVAIEGTEPISVETCVMPTISFLGGKLEFESGTDGAECHYEIKVEDAKEGVGSEMTLSSAYEISVYAYKEGYNDSEKNTATLYWINVDPISTGVIKNEMRVNTNAILVQNTDGAIAISGVADGDNVLIYNISGQLIAQGKASGNHADIGTNLSIGDICIIKIADKSVKYLMK